MDVYLIRHTKALDLGECDCERDEDRPLSEKGEEQARMLAHTLQRRGVELDLILSTPLLRARQTAEVIIDEWSASTPPELKVSERITPECKPRKLAKTLRGLLPDRVGVVGHQPDLGNWAAWLIGCKNAYLDFAKGGVAHISWERELSKGSGALLWLITPTWYESAEEPAEIEAVGV